MSVSATELMLQKEVLQKDNYDLRQQIFKLKEQIEQLTQALKRNDYHEKENTKMKMELAYYKRKCSDHHFRETIRPSEHRCENSLEGFRWVLVSPKLERLTCARVCRRMRDAHPSATARRRTS